jgi:hypothetical protein
MVGERSKAAPQDETWQATFAPDPSIQSEIAGRAKPVRSIYHTRSPLTDACHLLSH